MADPRALVRVLDELLWSLRRAGFTISTAQAIDVVRAAAAVGLGHPGHFRDAVAAVVVQRLGDRARFDLELDAFFDPAPGRSRRTLWERLADEGFLSGELSILRELLAELAAHGADGLVELTTLMERGADLDRLLVLAGVGRDIDADSALELGFRTHRLLGRLGVARARGALGRLPSLLRDALGSERGDALAQALATELGRAEDDVRSHVQGTYETRVAEVERQRAERTLATTPFSSLDENAIEEVRRAVRRFAERLRGGARVRARRALRGRIDPHRTLRKALRTGGVPLVLVRKKRRRDRPRLVLLCDVSDSVRAAAAFLLELTYAAQELFSRTRSFVFVSELGETTRLFAEEPVRVAIGAGVGRRRGPLRRQLQLRARPSRLRGAAPARARSPHHGRHPRRRAHQLPRRRRRGARPHPRALAGAHLALPRASRPVESGGQRHAPLRPRVHRGLRGALRRATWSSAARVLFGRAGETPSERVCAAGEPISPCPPAAC